MATENSHPLRPKHPDAERVAAAMRRINAFTESGNSPDEAAKPWTPTSLLVREADRIRGLRHGGDKLNAHDSAIGTTAYLFGFLTARCVAEPDRPLGQPAFASPFGGNENAQEMLAMMNATPNMVAAVRRLNETMSGSSDVASWQAAVSTVVNPEVLQWAALQSAYTLNGIETYSDQLRVEVNPGGADRLKECVGMFIDGYLLGAHWPT